MGSASSVLLYSIGFCWLVAMLAAGWWFMRFDIARLVCGSRVLGHMTDDIQSAARNYRAGIRRTAFEYLAHAVRLARCARLPLVTPRDFIAVLVREIAPDVADRLMADFADHEAMLESPHKKN